MGLGGILFILAVLVSLILFIVFTVKTAREAGAFHIVMMSILFIECWVFMVFVAGVQHNRVAATKDAKKEAERLEKVTQEVAKLRYGSASDPEEAQEAVIPVQGMLDRLTIDRGRVWRQVTFVNNTKVADKVQVQLSLQAAQVSQPADPNNPAAAAAPAAPAGRSLPQNLLVYGFHEQLDAEGRPLPVFYLGEYKVIASDEATGSVTLEGTQATLPTHQARIAQGTESWTLYELLPIDSHAAFSAPGSVPSAESVFGRPDDEKIKELLASAPPDVLKSYLQDGQRAADSDPPESIWSLLNLLKELKKDVDSDQSADATVSGYFDGIGRSIDIRLRRNEEVSLDPSSLKDNLVVVIESEAKKLIADGIAEQLQRVFVRPLNDYEELFNLYAARGFSLIERIKYFQHHSQLIDQANTDGQAMLAERQKEKQLLESDLSNYKKESEVLNSALAEVTAELDVLKKELSRMYQEIQGRRDRLVSSH
jgi:predicted lactoylglutathione lyase